MNWTPTTPTLSLADAETVTDAPETVAPAAGAVIETVGAVRSLFTVTLTAADVVVLPAPSRATAVTEWLPFPAVSVFHETEYGDAVSSAPRFTPSILNWTPTPAMLSAAVAVTVAVPVRVAPPAGAVTETVGGVLSTLLTVTDTALEVAVFPAASRATADSEWLPLATSVVFQLAV